jgi:putative phage-type endonuclease
MPNFTRLIHKNLTEEQWLELRSKNINASEISCLFDINPYKSYFELWWEKKKGGVYRIEESKPMKWGKRYEAPTAYGLAEDNNWVVRPMKEYIEIPELRIGSSFDFRILADGLKDSAEDSLLEIKHVGIVQFKDGWLVEDDSIEAPPFIELQLEQEMFVSELNKGVIGAQIGGNDPKVILRQAQESIHVQIAEKVQEFWQSIRDNREPEPDFKRDSKFIQKLLGYAEPGKTMTATEEITSLAKQYGIYSSMEKKAEIEKETIKAELLMKIGDTEKVKGEGFSISAGLIGPCDISYHRDGYRNFRIDWKKEKK